ncbi:MAG TPA: hypothetical protein VEI02_15375, partial [Planctomycetota bacterium]|nr:hypothetical protein [Planctomycetota bacterium]
AEDAAAKAAEALAWCLDVNAEHADGLAASAIRDLADGRFKSARTRLEKALVGETRHLRSLALLAAADYLEGDRSGAERRFDAVRKLDPTWGVGRRLLAWVLDVRRRWPEALEQARIAVAIDPTDPGGWDDLARFALYLGQLTAGTEALAKANEVDAFNQPWRRNMELVLDVMRKQYVALETERFRVRLHASEQAAFKTFYAPFIDRSFDLLTKKYGYVPTGAEEAKGRVSVEWFDHSSRFGARTFGYDYPGFLGVCFGPVVTLNGPKAMPPEMNSWARTFHHEFAHSIHLGLAQGKMPRWLTEGLATHEELAFEPSWTRGMDAELFTAWTYDDLLKTADFDTAFATPRIAFAYYQAGLVADHLVRTCGVAKVVDLLKAYADDLGTEAAFRRALGKSPEEIDREFEATVRARVGGFRMTPNHAPYLAKLEAARKAKPDDVETLVRLAWSRFQSQRRADAEAAAAEARRRGVADPRLDLLDAHMALADRRFDRAEALRASLAERGVVDYQLSASLGMRAMKANDAKTAEARLREASDAFPLDPSPDGPRVALATLLRGSGDVDGAMELFEEHLRHRSESVGIRNEVVAWRLGRGDKAEARRHLDLQVLIAPRDPDVHLKRGALQEEAGEHAGALASAEMALDAAPEGPKGAPVRADARVAAARALTALGRAADAREKLRAALVDAPAHEEALRLLEESGGPDGEKGRQG